MRHKRTLNRKCILAIALLLLLFVPPFWITYREYRQARLDHALIAAVKAGNDKMALEALAEGASGEARDIGEPPTLREALRHLWDRFRHSGRQDERIAGTPALVLLYQLAHQNDPLNAWALGPDVRLIRALLDHGAYVNERNQDGWNPLYYASRWPNRSTARLLLARGANTELADNEGETPLMVASVVNPGATKVLLEYGANLEARDNHGLTALMQAVIAEDYAKVRMLLEHGANVMVKDSDGKTALDWVTDSENPDPAKFIAILRKYGAK